MMMSSLPDSFTREKPVNAAVVDKVKAWKDPAFRASLPESERVRLDVPVASVDLFDPELGPARGKPRDFTFYYTCYPCRASDADVTAG